MFLVVLPGTGLLVHFMFTLPVAFLWMAGFFEPILVALGQDPTLSKQTSDYLAHLAPGLLGHTVMFTLNPFCQSTGDSRSPFYASLLAAVLHVPLNLLLLPRYGYLGAAAATSITQVSGPLMLYLLAFVLPLGGVGRPLHAPPLLPSPGLVASYLRLGLPGLVTISEWWASETAIFLAGSLPSPETSVAAMTLYQSVNSSCFMFSVGLGVASGARVGRFLGRGERGEARRAAWSAAAAAAAVSGGLGAALMLSDHDLVPSLFTDGREVVEETAKTIPLLSAYVFADGCQVALSGVLKGCGLQRWAAPVVVASYWGLAIPLGYWLSLGKEDGWGVVGLTAGMTAGTWMHFCLMCVLVGKVKWDKVASAAALSLDEQAEGGGDEGVGLVGAGDGYDDGRDLEGGGIEMVSQKEVEGEGLFGGLMVKISSSAKAKKQGYGNLVDMDTDDDDGEEEREEGDADGDDNDNYDDNDEIFFRDGGTLEGGVGEEDGDRNIDDVEGLQIGMGRDAEVSMDRLR